MQQIPSFAGFFQTLALGSAGPKSAQAAMAGPGGPFSLMLASALQGDPPVAAAPAVPVPVPTDAQASGLQAPSAAPLMLMGTGLALPPPAHPDLKAATAPLPGPEAEAKAPSPTDLVEAQPGLLAALAPAAQAPHLAPAPAPATPPAEHALRPTDPLAATAQTGPVPEAFVTEAVRQATAPAGHAPDSSRTSGDPRRTFQDLLDLTQGKQAQTVAPAVPGQAHTGPVQAPADPEQAPATTAQTRAPGPGPQENPPAALAQDGPPAALRKAADPDPETRTGPEFQTGSAVAPAPGPAPRIENTLPQQDAPPARPAEPEQVLRQVTRFVKVALDGKRSEVRLMLSPEHLGPVAVRLTLSEGAVRASLTAQNPQVREVLEANIQDLRLRMADHGFKVEQVQVTVGGDSGFAQFQQSPQGDQHRHAPSPTPSGHRWQGETEPEDEPRPQPRTQAGTILAERGMGTRINSLA